MRENPSPLARRALPIVTQARAVLVLALVTAALLGIVFGVAALRGTASVPRAPAGAAGTVRLSAAQLATLRIEPVRALPFLSEQRAEGKIALNGDTTTPVFSPYSGRVVRVIAPIGARVVRGAPLLAVEASEIVQAQSDLINAGSQLKLARINEERRHAAYEAKGGSLQDWQQAQADLVTAQTALAAAQNRLRILGRSDAEISATQSAARADALAYVLAPLSGVVTDRQVGPGQNLQAGSTTPVYTIGDLSSVWLQADVREVDAPLISEGQEVEVRVLALPERTYQARVTFIGASIDPVTRRVPVRAVIDNADHKLKPEMFASFSIITSAATVSPAVPEEAVVREGDTARVWVLEGADVLALRAIRTGRSHDGMVEVLQGLSGGERVVTRGSLFIDRAAQPG
jgi:cobalt-zinc-cadmium efflux system membrane fusion protein